MNLNADTEDIVSPYRLCGICQAIIESYTQDEYWRLEKDADETTVSPTSFGYVSLENRSTYTGPPFNGPQVRYHARPAEVRQSADRGCHLCSLLLGAFDNANECLSYMTKKNIVLTASACRNTRYTGCQKIQITLEAEKKETYHNEEMSLPRKLLLHRHQHGDRGCRVGNNERPNHSIDSRSKWCKSTESSLIFGSLRTWLHQCVDQHETCRRILSKKMPTRLLDLQAFSDSAGIRLIRSAHTRANFYATLSYRWGGTNSFMLNTENHARFESRISVRDLPRTIREAIEVCRKLSVRYLWIDALCILQDSNEDLAKEIANMGSIYAGSLFTVAATNSIDSESGCFRARHPLTRQICVFKGSDGVEWIIEPLQTKCNWHIREIQNALLSKRGWVFQEQILSPRTIHFTQNDIVWECREKLFCQMCVDGRQDGYPNPDTQMHEGKRVVIDWDKGLEKIEQLSRFRVSWSEILHRYTRTELTDTDDKLSALAGIAELISDELGYEASWGLWLDFFVDELQWYWLYPDARFAEIYGYTPSWSWVSSWTSPEVYLVLQAKEYEWQPKENCQELFVAEVTRFPPITAFQQISTLPTQSPQFHSFAIRGQLQICRSVPIRREGYSRWTLVPEPLSAPQEVLTAWNSYLQDESELEEIQPASFYHRSQFDYYPDGIDQNPANLVCFLLKRTFSSDDCSVLDSGLVLKQVDPAQKVYRRVGFFAEYISERILRDSIDSSFTPSESVDTGIQEDGDMACRNLEDNAWETRSDIRTCLNSQEDSEMAHENTEDTASPSSSLQLAASDLSLDADMELSASNNVVPEPISSHVSEEQTSEGTEPAFDISSLCSHFSFFARDTMEVEIEII
ncbi:heterokaryon incompatibility protein-domain-containing protein [Paraphoma chrysanthemicola]|uniref:Heterokaryon incompatibility protein-domain-containing protein n=1 Tax=Paraphoma chrysanthemicola TaxID=798071 RepID=A0A8K0R1T5_9PLEO|nr:heterokaryon incompatibility protein-domain-containing protein [Paraphoma chrysanthemicola]